MLLLEFIAARLRELRAKHGLTQEQMAVLLRTDVRWYQRLEWGEKDLRVSTIERLSAVFGVTAFQFLSSDVPETTISAKVSKAPHRPKRSAPKRKAE